MVFYLLLIYIIGFCFCLGFRVKSAMDDPDFTPVGKVILPTIYAIFWFILGVSDFQAWLVENGITISQFRRSFHLEDDALLSPPPNDPPVDKI